MVYRVPSPAPETRVVPERRGPVIGRFCRACGGVYSLHAGKHACRPVWGKDHIVSTCAHEGELFTAGADWWEPAVEVLPPPPPPPAPAATA